jgi:MoxR-like ATPase
MRWGRRQIDGGSGEGGRRDPSPTEAGPQGGHLSITETEIVACDRRGRLLATISLDLAALQAEAESAAAGTADPVKVLADAIAAHLGGAGARVESRDRTTLESTLSRALVAGEWPARIDVSAAAATTPPIRQGASRERRPEGDGGSAPVRPLANQSVSPTLPIELFESHLHYPLEDGRRVYESLVGLDDIKARLVKEAIVLTRPERLQQWSTKHHGSAGVKALAAIQYGTPLIIFAGDVGTGKTALAESFGDAVSRALGQPASLLRMSIQTRGSGIVGDMTRQISRAFRAVEAEARRTRHVTILLLDEADALAESRETQQMHHEDRAGVNALIQGVDHLRGAGIPALVVFCSNRLESIDPALLRRAVDVVVFRRPDATQRRIHLERLLGELPLNEAEWQRLVELTGPRDGREYGYTYSDISDRLVRKAVLEAFPDAPLSFALLERGALAMTPTRPFQGTST